MINVVIEDKEAENLFAEFLKPKVESFGKEFGMSISFQLKSNKSQTDIWLGIEREELYQKKTIEELSKYLRVKQWYASELRKRAMIQHDRFESYEIVTDLLACLLENKPVEGTTSIPILEDVDKFIEGVTPSLEKWDLVAMKELKESVLNLLKKI